MYNYKILKKGIEIRRENALLVGKKDYNKKELEKIKNKRIGNFYR